MGYRIVPARIALNKVLAHVRNCSNADAKDDEIEIVDYAQGLSRGFSAVPMRFEVAPFALKLASIDQLRIVRFRGPARQSPNVHQRCVLPCVFGFRLDVELQCFDVGALSLCKVLRIRQPYRLEAMEEFESYSALLQYLIHRREDRIAHARVHFPEDGAARAEQHP